MKMHAEDTLGYWLSYAHRTLAYALTEALRQCCVEHNKSYVVTPPQWGVLSLLDEMDGITVGTISQRRAIDAPTVTGIVKRLEQSGLVERRHDRTDRRVVKVYLTEEGRDIMRFLPDMVRDFNAMMTQGLSKEEKRDLQAKLQRMIVNASIVAPGTGDRFGLLSQDVFSV